MCTVLCCGAGDQTGGEEKAEGGNGGDVHGEPHLQVSSTAPQRGDARYSTRSVLENIETR